MDSLFEQIAEDYMLMLLNWAYKKTGDRNRAEDLTQEALLQIFASIKKSDSPIRDPEHFVWKVAHYTWCNYLRSNEHRKMWVPMEDLQLENHSDFAADYAEAEYQAELTRQMRRQISRLSFLQRDILISFYLDRQSVQEIARKHQMTESAVKWHLFQTRKKLKKEITTMESKEYIYRPRKLHMGISGQAPSMANTDIIMINNSMTKQNICIACYQQPQTAEALSERLGIPAAYIEDDLEWLVEKEFVEKNGTGYSTSFLISNLQDEQAVYTVYLKHKEALSDLIVNELCAARDRIKAIGFYGCDKPFDKLLWLLIYQCCHCIHIPFPDVERPVRMDGGKYLPLGFDRTDWDDTPKAVDTSGWAYNGSMCNDYFHWFGMYNFGTSEIETMLDAYTPDGKSLHDMLCSLIHSDFRIPEYDENQKYTLAQLAQKGFVSVDNGLALPSFCVLTAAQYKQLQETVFLPIAAKLEQETQKLLADLEECCRGRLPRQLKHYYNASVNLALGDLSYLTTFFAFQDKRLYQPGDKHDGEFLTLMYVRT